MKKNREQILLLDITVIASTVFLLSREFHCNLDPGRPKLINTIGSKDQIRHKTILGRAVTRNGRLKKE